MLFEVQGATNVEATSQCVYKILSGQWVTIGKGSDRTLLNLIFVQTRMSV